MLTRADVYGTAYGRTTDQNTQTGAPASPASVLPSSAAAVTNSGPALRGINPLYGAALLVGGLVGYKLLREWGRPHDADKDVKIAVHNGLVVTGFALAGIPLAKGIANAIATNAPAWLAPIAHPVRDYVLNA